MGYPSTNPYKYLEDSEKRNGEHHACWPELTSGNRIAAPKAADCGAAPGRWCVHTAPTWVSRKRPSLNTKHQRQQTGRKLPHLDERQHFVLYDSWRVGFGRDDLDQNAINEISVGHLDVKSVATVLHTRFQYLQRERERGLKRDRGLKRSRQRNGIHKASHHAEGLLTSGAIKDVERVTIEITAQKAWSL